MKKKLFTLLTLMLCVCGGAWAEANTDLINGITLPGLPTGTYQGGTTVVHKSKNNAVVIDGNGNSIMQASAPGYASPTGDFSWANAYDGSNDGEWSTTGSSWDSKGIFVGSDAYNNSSNAHNVGFSRRCNLRNVRTFAYRFTNCGGVSALVKSQGKTDAAAACMSVFLVGANNELTLVETVSSKTNDYDILTVNGLSSAKTYVAYIYGMNGSNGELCEIGFLPPSDDEPTISSSTNNITLNATVSGTSVTGNFTITGSNLTPGNYSLIVPSVEGLSVSPTSFTVLSDGTVNQDVIVSFVSTVNVPVNTVFISSEEINEKSLSVTVTYSATVETWILQSISGETIWNFDTDVAGSKEFEGDDLNNEFVYANISDLTYQTTFDATALAFKGQFPFRGNSNRYAQNGTLRFNTTVPGTIVVKFSDTGSKASSTAVKRYLVVNGKTTEYWTSRPNNGDNPYDGQLNVTTGDIIVPAGDVTISGTSAIIVSYLKFTPATEVSIAPAYTKITYVTPYPLDFSNVSGLKAYVATGASAAGVTTEEVGAVPAGTPLLLKGTDGTEYSVPVAAEASAPATNLLRAGDGTTEFNGSSYDYLLAADGKFYQIGSGTIAVGKAYLHLDSAPAGARSLSVIFADDMTTGIETIANETKADNTVYNLGGQRVAQPTKGLYIVNGKKIIK